MKSYLSPKIKLRSSKIGKGLFAIKPIKKDELAVDFSTGPGQYVNNKKAHAFFLAGFDYSIQISPRRFFAATNKREKEEADYINHSCNPNCGIQGMLKIVAMRPIKIGEEITFDYAMTESSPYRMPCQCGASNCRGLVTGNDWKIPQLQKRYRKYFSDYLLKKIAAQK